MVEACGANVTVEQNPGVAARNHSRNRSRNGPRQGHDHRLAGNFRPGRMAGAVDRRIHRQAGQRHHPGRSRRYRLARRLRQRSRVRLRAPGIRAGQGAGRQGRRTRASRASRRPHPTRRHLRSGPGILPLGNRHRRCRLDHRHQSPSTSRTSKPARSRLAN